MKIKNLFYLNFSLSKYNEFIETYGDKEPFLLEL